jgi:hypothetical protein
MPLFLLIQGEAYCRNDWAIATVACGRLRGHLIAEPVGLSIEIPLAPFTIDEEVVETSICLGSVSLPSTDVLKLGGAEVQFSRNPKPGYINGSVHVQQAHHPVDVTSIRFGPADGSAIEMEPDLLFVFEFEGLDDYRNTSWALITQIGNSEN